MVAMPAAALMSHPRVEVFQCLTSQCDNSWDYRWPVGAALMTAFVVADLRHAKAQRLGSGCLGVSQASAPGLQVGAGHSAMYSSRSHTLPYRMPSSAIRKVRSNRLRLKLR